MLSAAKHPCIGLKINTVILRGAQDDGLKNPFFSILLGLRCDGLREFRFIGGK
jgi:hypothetical protein